MRTRNGLLLICLGAVACATSPPPLPTELVNARAAYTRALQGPAPRLAPQALDQARVALAAAEDAFARHPRAARTRDLAYFAERRAQRAEVIATGVRDRRVRAWADRHATSPGPAEH